MRARLIIVDDEPLARQRMIDLLEDISSQFSYELVASCASGDELFQYLKEGSIDIALLDVQMPGLNGLQIAEKLATQRGKPSVIFVTAFDGFAVDAFDVEACDYLLKPIKRERLLAALERALERRQAQIKRDATSVEPPAILTIAERGKITRLPIQEIVFVKAEQKYISIHTDHQTFLSEQSLAQLEQTHPDHFIRIHRNTLVAREAIRSVKKSWDDNGKVDVWNVIIQTQQDGEVKLKVSRRLWSQVKDWVVSI